MVDCRIDGFGAEVVHGDHAALVVVHGEVDLHTAPAFRAALDEALDGSGRVEVDLSDTTFMDSCGLVALFAAHRRLGRAREAVVICNPRPQVRLVLDITGVGALFDVRPRTNHAAGHDTNRR
jgi:anti-sigma B factor antagonist